MKSALSIFFLLSGSYIGKQKKRVVVFIPLPVCKQTEDVLGMLSTYITCYVNHARARHIPVQ